jgi:CsoR family transcriptional regulator, copper-sensing transcriptional repressor
VPQAAAADRGAGARACPHGGRGPYCIDIVTQIAAVRAALRRAEEEILRDHVASCVDEAVRSGNRADQRRKIAELMDVVGRAER